MGKRSRATHRLQVEAVAAQDKVFLQVKAETKNGVSDQLTMFAKVSSKGFPQDLSKGGFISSQRKQKEIPDFFELPVKLPDTYVAGSLRLEAKVMSSSFATLLEAVEALVKDPYGCFEQTSSTTYPVIMAYNFVSELEETKQTLDLKARLEEKMNMGYKKLVTFETPEEGYEWFGSSPPHEALSAYGLQEFTDMAANSQIVDPVMLDRLKTWILSRKDGKGSFKLSDQALDSFGRAPQVTTDAYILWSLTHAGVKTGLDKEVDALMKQVDSGDSQKDPYVIGLLSCVLWNLGRSSPALKYAKMLPAFIQTIEELHYVDGAKTSITSSEGRYLQLEATSVAILAWLPFQSEFTDELEKTINTLV